MRKQSVGLTAHHAYVAAAYELVVELGFDAWCRSKYKLVVGEALRSSNHLWQCARYLLLSTACEQRYDGTLIEPMLTAEGGIVHVVCSLELSYLLRSRVAYVMDGVVVLLFEERHLERQNREKLVDVALNLLDAILLPCPYLR